IALESHEPGEGSQQVRFEVEEWFMGLASDVKEYVLPLELAEPLRRGEKRIVVEAAKLAPRQNHELAVIYEKEKQKGNANLATLAVARKMVAYLLAVDCRQRAFVPADHGTAVA